MAQINLTKKILALSVTLSYYSYSTFLLFTLLGVKRYIQFSTFAIVYTFVCATLINITTIKKQHMYFFMLFGFAFLTDLYNHRLSQGGFGYIAALFFSYLLLFDFKLSDITIKYIIYFTFFLSILHLAQLMICWNNLNLIKEINIKDNLGISEGRITYYNIPDIAKMGLGVWTENIFWGGYIPRAKSFGTEPSILPAIFLIPLSFALILNNRKTLLLAVPIFLFSLFSYSGTIYLIYAIAFLSCLMLKLLRNRFWLWYLSPILFFIVILYIFKNNPGIIYQLLQFLFPESFFQSRSISGMERLINLINLLNSFSIRNLFIGSGTPESKVFSGGHLFQDLISYGIFIFTLRLIVFHYAIRISMKIFKYYKYKINRLTLGILLFQACWVVAYLVTAYGYVGFVGSISLVLFISKIEDIERRLFFPNPHLIETK